MTKQGAATDAGLFAPLEHAPFRRIWLASIPSNLGLLINAVGAGWAMTVLSGEPGMVALVQTALMLPYMIFAVPAGAIADTYDRRKVAMFALVFATICSAALFIFAGLDLLTPWLLLFLCFFNGMANSLFGPAWMSSVSEQVPRQVLPLGIALNSMSYNIARAVGPALGGILVAAAGPVAAFGFNAASYLPMLWAKARWRREAEKPRLPPEQVTTAVLSGLRYVIHSVPLRRTIMRTVLFGLSGASIQALMPLIASQQLAGGASLYGVLLGSFGLGAVLGAWTIAWARSRVSLERQIKLAVLFLSISFGGVAWSSNLYVSCALLVMGGVAWMQTTNTLGVSVQARAPRWVTGRAVATFQASIAGGIAIGSWLWGVVADHIGLGGAVGLSAACLLVVAVMGVFIPIAPLDESEDGLSARLSEPDVALDISGRSGPVVVTIEYEIALDDAREFHGAMMNVRRIRLRNGAYGWSLSRDIADPRLWLERFHTPTWHDYLRHRERLTEMERQAMIAITGTPTRVRRLLERPTGSVRWKDESADHGITFPPHTE